MDRNEWAKPVSRDMACRRAAGRSKFNLWRKREADLRRLHVADMLSEQGNGRGVQSQIARRLCLDRGTISRDVAEIRKRGWDRWEPRQRLERRQKIVAQIYGLVRANNAQ
jgi:DNA-binding MarR family transcriptional regulator